ncbi:tRNA (adenosine(37)-N6)-dimethylallyltransferase MiaA, partial [Candidatus Uhrbacteria bacterium]|nr:tRNA (adenosine(37)-N6)-dimethylallyltransferase MiaA [Candidatus Uhrbacteria bacterium]
MTKLPKILAIVGPTASGKTDLALKLARKFNGELIAADSRTVYKKMNIGTAKPTDGRLRQVHDERAYVVGSGSRAVPIFLMDLVTPDKIYTVAEFKQAAEKIINKILKAGKLPIVVGGTGLYIQALLENWQLPMVAPNMKLRQKLEKELAQKGLSVLYKRLVKLDPACAKFIDKHNPRRVIRALEVILTTGQMFSQSRGKLRPLY